MYIIYVKKIGADPTLSIDIYVVMNIFIRHNESHPIFESALKSLSINNIHMYIVFYIYIGAFSKRIGVLSI
jgi:hypothetical protein